MKKFNFKLQSVLKYREYLEDLARQETSKAFMDVMESIKAIEKLKFDYSKVFDDLNKAILKTISADEFRQYHNYLNSIENDILEKTAIKTKLKKILLDKQKILTQKTINKKIIELLKKKKKTQYMEKLRKIEQNIIDEAVVLKKVREKSDFIT